MEIISKKSYLKMSLAILLVIAFILSFSQEAVALVVMNKSENLTNIHPQLKYKSRSDIWNITGTETIIDTETNISEDVYIYGTLYISNSTVRVNLENTIKVMTGGRLEILNSKILLNKGSLKNFWGWPVYFIRANSGSIMHLTNTYVEYAEIASVSNQVEIKDCTFFNLENGLYFSNTTQVIIENSLISKSGNLATIYLENITNSLIKNNTIESCNGSGIMISDSQNITIQGNILRNNTGYGLKIDNSKQIDIIGNSFINNKGKKIVFVANQGGSSWGIREGGGLRIDNCEQINFTDNTFYNDTIQFGLNNFTTINIENSNKINNKNIILLFNDNNASYSDLDIGELILATCDNVTLENITAAALDIVNSTGIYVSDVLLKEGTFGITTSYSHNITLNRIESLDFSTGMYIDHSQNIYSQNITISNSSLWGIYIGSAENITVNTFQVNVSLTGVKIADSSGITISNGITYWSKENAIDIKNSSLVLVMNITVQAGGTDNKTYFPQEDDAFYPFEGTGIFLENAQNVTVSHSKIINCTIAGIYMRLSENIRIVNNFISSCRTGIKFPAEDADKRVDILNNTIEKADIGIFLLVVFTANISYNSFFEDPIAIYISSPRNTTLDGNRIQEGFMLISVSSYYPYEFKPSELRITNTNTIDGSPVLYMYHKSSVTVANKTVSEIFILDCDTVNLRNVSSLGIFINNAQSVKLYNVSLQNPIITSFINSGNIFIQKILIENFTSRNGNTMSLYSAALQLEGKKVTIKDATIENCDSEGIVIFDSENIEVADSRFIGNKIGLYFAGVDNLNITRNNFTRNDVAIACAPKSLYIYVYLNNFVDNKKEINAKNVVIHLDYNGVGNYWDKYNGTDKNNDGIGDAPFQVEVGYVDHYPLISIYNASYFAHFTNSSESSQNNNLTQSSLQLILIAIFTILVIFVIVIVYIKRRNHIKIKVNTQKMYRVQSKSKAI